MSSRRGSPFSGASAMNHFMEIAKMRAARAAVGEDRQAVQSEEPEIDGAADAFADFGLEPRRRRMPSTMWCARASRRWPRRWATRSRCTPTRSTKPSRCRRISRRASPATRRFYLQEETGITQGGRSVGGPLLRRSADARTDARAWAHHRGSRGAGRHGESDRDRLPEDADRGSGGAHGRRTSTPARKSSSA